MEDAARARMGDVMVRESTRDCCNWRESCMDVLVLNSYRSMGSQYCPAPYGELWTQAGDPSRRFAKVHEFDS